eukprot:32725-Chlamydomonas_euryale.AAC.19
MFLIAVRFSVILQHDGNKTQDPSEPTCSLLPIYRRLSQIDTNKQTKGLTAARMVHFAGRTCVSMTFPQTCRAAMHRKRSYQLCGQGVAQFESSHHSNKKR